MKVLEKFPELVCPACKGELKEDDKLRCQSCATEYSVKDGIPHMLPEDMKAFAEEIAVQDRAAQEYEQKRYELAYARRYHDWWDHQMLSRVRPGGRVLDNGCGTGTLLAKMTPGTAVGLDISTEMLRYASQHGDTLVLGNSQELPLEDASFDVVFCRSLLHHLPEPEIAVKEIDRVLRPGGESVFIDTNTSILSSLPRRIANHGEHFSDGHQNLSRRVLEGYLSPFFTIDDVMYFGYIAYPLLGFPDILNLFRWVPFKRLAEPLLMAVDGVLSRIPGIRSQSWGILVKATKKGH